MSVILFHSKNDVFTKMAQSYEGLKRYPPLYAIRSFTLDEDDRFYKALRRLYFANVACYLCQYHGDTPLPPSELTKIETFADVEQQGNLGLLRSPPRRLIKEFLDAWGSLTYNLCTNDGERYRAVDSYDYMNNLAYCYALAYVDSLEGGL